MFQICLLLSISVASYPGHHHCSLTPEIAFYLVLPVLPLSLYCEMDHIPFLIRAFQWFARHT